MAFFHKNDKRRNAQRKRRERERISKLQNLEERERELGEARFEKENAETISVEFE